MLLLLDAAGCPLTPPFGDRRLVKGRLVPMWPRVVRAWIEAEATAIMLNPYVPSKNEWTTPPWASREASGWAFAGKRLWC